MLSISSARLDKSAAPGGNSTSPPGAYLSVIKSNIDGDELAVAEVGGHTFLDGGQGNDVVSTAGKQLTVGGGTTLDVATAVSSSASAAAGFSVASAVAADALGAASVRGDCTLNGGGSLNSGGHLNGGSSLNGGGPLNGGSSLNGGGPLNGMCMAESPEPTVTADARLRGGGGGGCCMETAPCTSRVRRALLGVSPDL